MTWGRYSGFFYYRYGMAGKRKIGPFETREEAEYYRDKAISRGEGVGKVFQVERPVYF